MYLLQEGKQIGSINFFIKQLVVSVKIINGNVSLNSTNQITSLMETQRPYLRDRNWIFKYLNEIPTSSHLETSSRHVNEYKWHLFPLTGMVAAFEPVSVPVYQPASQPTNNWVYDRGPQMFNTTDINACQ